MQASPHPSLPGAGLEPEELVRFREAWKAEVQQKKGRRDPAQSTDDSDDKVTPLAGPSSEQIAGNPTLHSVGPPALKSAIELYRQAVDHEQAGRLDDALRLYRSAFRMDPNVDKAFHREEKLATISPTITHGTVAVEQSSQRSTTAVSVKPAGVVTGTLTSLVLTFPGKLVFEPENEKEPIPLNTIPDEVLVLILRKLDHSTLERFASVSRKARMLSLDAIIWKEFVEMTYKPPQVPNTSLVDDIVGQYLCDYRRVYVEHPRLRMDGVYIAVCHYVRQGLSENAWVNVRSDLLAALQLHRAALNVPHIQISHLITYHRYLRFFPNGQVLSLLANEERAPQELIPLLKPTLRMKGLSIGTWCLDGTDVHITNLLDASYLPLPPIALSPTTPSFPIHTSLASDTTSSPRYLFQMTLSLHSRPLGRWNKLELHAYESVGIETGEVCALGLKHERPFWFSKVRSWV